MQKNLGSMELGPPKLLKKFFDSGKDEEKLTELGFKSQQKHGSTQNYIFIS